MNPPPTHPLKKQPNDLILKLLSSPTSKFLDPQTRFQNPSLIYFSYRSYKARRQLTAIDWNFHLGLEQATTKSGEKMVTRKYNQRTRLWDVKIVKADKGYEYIPVLMSKILRRRVEDDEGIARIVDLNASDPAIISPTIAHIPAPPTKEIAQRRSRFTKEQQ